MPERLSVAAPHDHDWLPVPAPEVQVGPDGTVGALLSTFIITPKGVYPNPLFT